VSKHRSVQVNNSTIVSHPVRAGPGCALARHRLEGRDEAVAALASGPSSGGGCPLPSPPWPLAWTKNKAL